MSDSNLPPEQWRPLFDKRQIDFGYRPLAAKLDMNHTRIRRLLLGGGTTDDAVHQVADFFGVPVAKVRELRGEAAVNREPFTLPDDAGRLTERERDVIRSMVRVLLEAREMPNAVPADSSTQSDAQAEVNENEEVDSSDEPEFTAPARTDRAAADLRKHIHADKNRSDKRA
ncbi:hypothetical protein ABFW14_08380 [Mycolicibacterium fortuitum]|uniref:hypothetical protein n=1 Tax=Mycolicibacterium fortuitum TaxID=1766 RepID=UPI0034CFC2C3